MKIERFEDIEAWQLARELTRKVYRLTKKPGIVRDYGLKRQIQDAAGSSMHNNSLKIVKTSICKIPPNLPLPKGGITPLWQRGGGEIFQCLCQFNYEAVRGFISYPKKYEERNVTTRKP